MKQTACFSGYRPEKFSFILLDGQEAYLELEARIKAEVGKAVNDGYDTFLCGMAKGFDLICGSIVLRLKQDKPEYANIRLIAVPPYHGHRFYGPWGVIHSLVMGKADEVIYPTDKQNSHVYHIRNRYMVNNSSRLICYFDGQPGGTSYTIDYARNKGLEIINLHQTITAGDYNE